MAENTDSFGLRNLEQRVDENVAGVEAAWYTEASNLVNFPALGPLLIEADLQLLPGATWYQLVSVRRSVRYKQTPKDQGKHGQSWTQKFTGALAKHTEGLAGGLETLEGRKLVCLYRDMNGQVQLVGTPEHPLVFSDVFDSGLEPFGQRNGFDWTLQGETVRRARPYRGTWTVSGRGLEYAVELQQGGSGTVLLKTADGRLLATVTPGKTVVLKSGFKLSYTIS
ncbi:hypothetical protein [Hymenobacter chitinivorans]|uniref:Uncharacterized protein n=1 Tax=Hymenobacter chitinivorans DSM 11115 TaxID=1121954 RepID=A0A2M9BNA6_9BACT|nr:hypothetical protein [Hymenobacter chitinivorans]PJJ59424.1 hypothetical protein CLV45_0841 [Hymenobacter chitinivorans DSM 11115]